MINNIPKQPEKPEPDKRYLKVLIWNCDTQSFDTDDLKDLCKRNLKLFLRKVHVSHYDRIMGIFGSEEELEGMKKILGNSLYNSVMCSLCTNGRKDKHGGNNCFKKDCYTEKKVQLKIINNQEVPINCTRFRFKPVVVKEVVVEKTPASVKKKKKKNTAAIKRKAKNSFKR